MARGLAAAAERQPDFLLWLNDDVVLDRHAVADAIACHDAWASATGQSPVVVGATRDPQTGQPTYGGQRSTGGWLRPFRFGPVPPSAVAQPCDTFQGNIVLVPIAAHRRLGGISAVFAGVQGMADTDFGLRARRAGLPVVQAPGTLGTCAANPNGAPWTNPALPPGRRLAMLVGPRGFPPRAWLTFAVRHGGPLGPVLALFPYLRQGRAALRPARPAAGTPRVAWMDGVIPHYRLPLLRGLAGAKDWSFTVFHGPEPRNYSAVMTDRPLPLPTRPVRHRASPDGRRILWTGGVLAALRDGYDVVVAAGHIHDLGVWLLWLWRRLFARPRLVLSGHFRLEGATAGRWRWKGRLRAVLARGADAVLTYTPRQAAECARHGIAQDRLFVTHNTIDVAAARAAQDATTPAALDDARARHRLPEAPLFLFVGRLYAAKRVDLAIEAVDLLRRRGRDCTLLVVGDGPERRALAALAEGNPAVRLSPPLVDEAQLAPLFRLATAAVCPGAVGLVVAHAFAHGTPLVTCRDAPGHGVEIDYLADGVNGLCAAGTDAGALADALASLIDQPDRLERLRDGARLTADGLAIDRMVDATLAGLRRSLSGTPCAAVRQAAP
jgi:glycosyltransferase involved in cell wall biosynthesis